TGTLLHSEFPKDTRPFIDRPLSVRRQVRDAVLSKSTMAVAHAPTREVIKVGAVTADMKGGTTAGPRIKGFENSKKKGPSLLEGSFFFFLAEICSFWRFLRFSFFEPKIGVQTCF